METQDNPRGWRSFFAGWQFRDSTPRFEPGEQIEAYLTDYDPTASSGEARIGDTVLTVAGARPEQVERIVSLRIDRFNADAGTGEATIVE